ncbi:MAG: type III pantothenate kinase [Oscillospiraceae bacterium]|nr:type III pantothenate kinase [Oscillospiraceae bacterium]
MILTVDIGNTNIVFGCVEDGRVIAKGRIATNRSDLTNDYYLRLRQMFEIEDIDYRMIEGAIISSVVPQIVPLIKGAVKKLMGIDCMVVGMGIKTGMNIKIDDPGTLGADLITTAVGAVSKYSKPLVIVDMGTATTMIAVDGDGAFIGGSIIPGVKLGYRALSSGTSLLPEISIESPKRCIGTNTVDCMTSGAVFGAAAMIDGMLERMEEEIGQPVTAIATGGIARHIVPYCKRSLAYDPDLIHTGLEIIYNKNSRKKK